MSSHVNSSCIIFYFVNLLPIWAANIAMVTHSLSLKRSLCWREGTWWIGKYWKVSELIGYLAVFGIWSGFLVGTKSAWESSGLYSKLYTFKLLVFSSALCICSVVSLASKSTHYIARILVCASTVLNGKKDTKSVCVSVCPVCIYPVNNYAFAEFLSLFVHVLAYWQPVWQ